MDAFFGFHGLKTSCARSLELARVLVPLWIRYARLNASHFPTDIGKSRRDGPMRALWDERLTASTISFNIWIKQEYRDGSKVQHHCDKEISSVVSFPSSRTLFGNLKENDHTADNARRSKLCART